MTSPSGGSPKRRSPRIAANLTNGRAVSHAAAPVADEVEENIFLFIPNLIGYSRVILALASLYYMPLHPRTCSFLYSVSALLDALDGKAARAYEQSTRFGAVLDMVTDRCTTSCLLVFLASAFPRWSIIYQGLISLDLSSHYMHMYATLSMAGSGASHKNVSEARNWILNLYYSNNNVLFTVCAMDQVFFLALYLLSFSSPLISPSLLKSASESMQHGGPAAPSMIWITPWSAGAMEMARANKMDSTIPWILAAVSFPVMFFKQFVNVVQLVNASKWLAEGDRETRKKQGLPRKRHARLMRKQIVISALCSLGMVIFPNSSFHVVAALGGSPALALQVQIPVTDNGPEVYMSLYYDAVNFLVRPAGSDESLATILHRASSAKTKASQVYALVSEATKWSSVLSGIIEQTEILKHEKKLSAGLALLLTHDLLLAKGGVAASREHVLRLAITRHKTRLNAEFVRARVRAGFASAADWKQHLESVAAADVPNVNNERAFKHPRWIRINTLRTSLEEQIARGTFGEWATTNSTAELSQPVKATKSLTRLYHVDEHVPDLIATPPGTDLSKTAAYRTGAMIFQEKASCFPAYLLDPHPSDGDFIDTCAAPGNKTTHLVALLRLAQRVSVHFGTAPLRDEQPQRVYACERDPTRSLTLQKMVRSAGAEDVVTVLAGQDFLRLDPHDPRFARVGALLLDPSCSGSGIVGRDDGDDEDSLPPLVLPRAPAAVLSRPGYTKKRKRDVVASSQTPRNTNAFADADADAEITRDDSAVAAATPEEDSARLEARLAALSGFQLALLTRAFAFPAARKVVYSTCSVHAAENELVVARALASDVAHRRGWRVLAREAQVDGMRRWAVRGDVEALRRYYTHSEDSIGVTGLATRLADACLRCEKGTVEGTMGFFAVGFVRDAEDGRNRPGDVLLRDGIGEAKEACGEDEAEWSGLESD